MERCIHGIFDIEEVAFLLTIPVIRVCALEKLHSSGLSDLTEGLVYDTTHITLMAFVGSENVDILQTNDMIQPATTFCMNIEKMLRVAIHVERTQARPILVSVRHACRSITICRGGRRINEALPPLIAHWASRRV